MTDKANDPEITNAATAAAPETPPVPQLAKTTPPVPAPAPKSGRGLAAFALLVALGAGGGSGYLWYLGQQDQAAQTTRLDQAIKQAIAQRDPEFQALKNQIQQLQTLKGGLDQLRADNQALKEQLLGLTGDLQPLKNAMELSKGEVEIVKGEIKLLRESQDAHKTTVQQQKEQLDAALREQETRLGKLSEHLQNLQLSHNGLTENLETVKTVAAQGGDVNAFPLAEANYLLRLADAKLKLERNVPAARLALEAAQQRLKAVNENGLAPLRTMLGEAIASLRGVKLPDFSGLAHKILELEKDADALPLKLDSGVPDIKSRVKPATSATVSDDANRSLWDRATEAVWNQFKDIVVIRRERSEAPPLIAREEEYFLRQNLLLALESMRMALLGDDAQAFQDSYQQIRDWVEKYFDTQDPRVVTFLAELQALQAVQFNPYIPDLTRLNQGFDDFMTQRQPIRTVRRASASSTVAPAAPATEVSTEQPAAGRE
ncbi:MAG: uroporphyrinogen-III C-methyltransferase [Candidatus Competibacter sp.]|nr:uroporphyrinogen-III C-methyltransferase [Candidatus Competibacter sp.]